jgi:hypothetical protein
VLMTAEALERLAQHLMALADELANAADYVLMRRRLNRMSPFDPNRARFEEEVLASSAQFLAHHTRRQALPQLPAFPPESELILAREAWLKWIGVPEGWELPDELGAPMMGSQSAPSRKIRQSRGVFVSLPTCHRMAANLPVAIQPADRVKI